MNGIFQLYVVKLPLIKICYCLIGVWKSTFPEFNYVAA